MHVSFWGGESYLKLCHNECWNQIPPQHVFVPTPKISMYESGFLVASNANWSRKGMYYRCEVTQEVFGRPDNQVWRLHDQSQSPVLLQSCSGGDTPAPRMDSVDHQWTPQMLGPGLPPRGPLAWLLGDTGWICCHHQQLATVPCLLVCNAGFCFRVWDKDSSLGVNPGHVSLL